MPSSRTSNWLARLVLAVALIAATLLAAGLVVPPRAKPTDTAATSFSADRAMQDLEVVAAEPHPIGSAAQHRVRDYLLAQARALDLPVEVQRDEGSGAENVIVRMPGTSHAAHDVLITAHYDSTPNGPGAGDNGMAVAVMLETMRVLHAREPLTNDIVFLFTDGEEEGQTGIAAYLDDYPDADRVAVAFVFEGLPESGGTELRTTTPGDAWLIDELADASLPAFANSALNTSDRDRIGNDFAAFAPAGIVAAEYLTEGHVVRYHNAGDNVAATNAGVVQDHGETMVALAEHFGNLDLTAARISDSDRIFFSVPVVGLVSYQVWLAQALAVIAAVGFLVIVGAAWRRRIVSGPHLVWGTLVVPGLAVAFTALAWAAWQLLLGMNPESEQTLHYPDFDGSTTAMAVIGAVAGLAFVTVCHWLARRLGVLALAVGALVWWTLLTLLIAIEEPLFSPVALWPLLGGVTAVAVAAWVSQPWARVGLLALAAIPALVIAVPLLILEAINVEQGPLVAVPVLMLLLGSLLPQLLLITGRLRTPRVLKFASKRSDFTRTPNLPS
ncbi:M20/M25/M40 family metallo-hydrolase [Nocardioides sp. NPDC051685]|uniref:M20/M25/M40 family metallo-hydrolase n=1 Tax=Nocardioides sp. NPDC051685 TaxID=3364334 RepID=UPI0037AABD9D